MWGGTATGTSTSNGSVIELDWPAIGRRLSLSPREMQVMHGIFAGGKHASIARDLNMSPHTLDTHWRRIKHKLKVDSPIAAVHRIYEVMIQMRVVESKS